MKIVKMTEDDLREVSYLERECFSNPWSYDSFHSEFMKDDSFLFVAKEEKQIIGYIVINIIVDEGYILNVAVSKEHRKKGIASELIEDALFLAKQKKLRFLSLEVRSSNIPAKKLYEKFGFAEVTVRKDYYSSPKEDAILYTKYFEEELC